MPHESRSRARRHLCAVALLCLLVSALPARASHFQARVFGQADGLQNLYVTALVQQADGHLWVATENGLFRYDGTAFTEFGRANGLADPAVFSLLIDPSGTLWAGTHNGLFRFDGAAFHEIRRDDASLRIGVNSMLAATPAGELIAASAAGIVSVERVPPSREWTAMLYRQRHPGLPISDDTDGIALEPPAHPGDPDRLWLGCEGRICLATGSQIRAFGPAQGVPHDFYVSLFFNREGRLFARGRKHILSLPRSGDAFADLTPALPPGAIETTSRRFTQDAVGDLLTPTARGIATWDGRRWTETVATSAGPLESVTNLLCDAEGAIWIGTAGLGLLQSLGYGRWQHIGTSEGIGSPSVSAVAGDARGRVWLGHEHGVNLYVPATGQVLPSPFAKETDAAFFAGFAPSPDGGMWAATMLGRVLHATAAGRVDRRFSIDTYIQRILLDGQGTLWIAGSQGLVMLSCPGACRPLPFAPDIFGKADLKDLALGPDGSLWVASRRGLDRIQFTPSLAITHVVPAGGASPISNVLLDPDGTLWTAGQRPGVTHLRLLPATARQQSPSSGEVAAEVLETLHRPQLASDLVQFLGRDAAGRLWIGGDHGVNVSAKGKLVQIAFQDGLLWNETNEKGFFAQPDGSVWIGTSKGVSHLLHPEDLLARPPFPTVIEDVQYGDHPLLNGEQLRWSGATLLLRFTALTFRNNRTLLFHYQLLGVDAEPTTTSSPFVRFAGLPHGSYTFRVVAEDHAQGVFSAPAEFRFTLSPPWWRSFYFYTLTGLALLLMFAALWHTRHLALLARSRRLESLVQERTAALERMANRDPLTELLNRRALFAGLTAEYERARDQRTQLAVALIDLDHFKEINDTLGHLAGDEVLRQTADRLSSIARNTDIVGRYGGEEFLIVFRNAPGWVAVERSEIIRRSLADRPIRFGPHLVDVTCSIGVACTETFRADSGDGITDLLAEADRALYAAKANGRNQVDHAVPAA